MLAELAAVLCGSSSQAAGEGLKVAKEGSWRLIEVAVKYDAKDSCRGDLALFDRHSGRGGKSADTIFQAIHWHGGLTDQSFAAFVGPIMESETVGGSCHAELVVRSPVRP
jgi:hypothetical protein